MNNLRVSSLRRVLNSEQFKTNFNNVTLRYVEICIDENNRQILQIDFNINETQYPMYGYDLSMFGEALTDFLTDKSLPAIFNSCTTNSVDRLYYRAYVKVQRLVSDPEDGRKTQRIAKPKSTKLELSPDTNQQDSAIDGTKSTDDDVKIPAPTTDKPIYQKLVETANKPGCRHGIGFVKAEEPNPTSIPSQQNSCTSPQNFPMPSNQFKSDPELKVKFDKLNLKSFALEQEVVNLKAKIIDKETEIKALADRKPEAPPALKIDTLEPQIVAAVRRAVSRVHIPLITEKKFAQHHIDRTPHEIVLDTYYLCEFLGLRTDALYSLQHIIENLRIPETADDTSRLMYSLLMPHIRYLIKRNEEMRR